MTDSTKILIESKTVKEHFKTHLDIQENKRILFSAPFGAGKSFFLRDFFTQNEYVSISLFPVDYPVANNQDILELIKYDILNALITNFEDELELQDVDFNLFLMIHSFIMHKLDFFSLGKKILSAVNPGSDGLMGVMQGVKGMAEKYNAYVNELSKDEIDKVANYIAGMKNQKGSIRESDGITEMIKDFIGRIKNRKSGKPVVLILDDLDRLDPDHIFRLINIFTAHYDSQQERNKFGFDKVILVCDHQSLGDMFRHRYGSKADFTGYIDKFYSVKPFEFNNAKYLAEKIDELMKPKMRLVKDGVIGRMDSAYLSTYNQYSDHYNVFRYILEYMIKRNIIKIRNFDRAGEYSLPHTQFQVHNRRSYDCNFFEFLVLANNLKQFFPSFSELKNAFERCSENFISDFSNREYNFDDSSLENYLINTTLPFIVDEQIVFNKKRVDNHQEIRQENFTMDRGFEAKINYRKDSNNDSWNGGITYVSCSYGENPNDRILRPNPFWFFLTAFDYCEKKHILSR